MKLHEIIKHNENPKTAILIEKMLPYKKLLLRYYRNVFPSEPCLMVTSVFNAAQYAKIVPINELYEAMCEYIEEGKSEADIEEEMEIISAHSCMLSDLITEGGDMET